MAKMVFGIFESRDNAESAIDELESEGFDPKDISIVMQDQGGQTIIRNNAGSNVADSTASGAATGAVVGGLAGLLIGIGAIAIPGIGALLIGGPLAAALGIGGAAATTISGAATGAIAGGLIGALVGIGVPEEDARIYENSIKKGAILVVVPALTGESREANAILRENGAEQIKTVDMRDSNARRDDIHAGASI